MQKYSKTMAVLLALFLALGFGCQSLDTVNLNNPDEERALSEPGDVEALISGAMLTWFGIHNYSGYEHTIVTADALTCSWGNFSMRDSSSEPRIAYNNSTSYTYNAANEIPWTECYRAISAVNDGLRQIEAGLVIGDAAQTHRAKSFAKLIQGLAHAHLASFFDQAFIFDENIDIANDVLEFKPYTEVRDEAVKMLEAAAQMMETGPAFTTESGWINGITMTNVELAQMAHSYAARCIAQNARTPAERAAADWAKVKSHAEQGLVAAFAPNGGGTTSSADWTHSSQRYHNDRGGSWARLDYKMIGPGDKSGGYENWLNTPVQLRTEFDMDTDDKRLWDGTVDADGNQNEGIYGGNWGSSPFRANRGTYHFSKYGWKRYEEYRNNGLTAPMPVFHPEENDFLIAEALLWMGGSLDEVAALINKTRVNNGGYPAATAAAGAGSATDKRDPKPGANLWQMLKYEKHMEILMTGPGVEFFDNRGWGDLVTATPLHWPVPAKELEVLQQELYTFGGGGAGSAPKALVQEGRDIHRVH